MNFEVVWSGSTWRMFDIPVGTLPDVTLAGKESKMRGEIHDALCAVMNESYQSVSAIQERAGVSEVSARKFVARMVRRGVLETISRPNPRGGCPVKLYRRVQREQVAA